MAKAKTVKAVKSTFVLRSEDGIPELIRTFIRLLIIAFPFSRGAFSLTLVGANKMNKSSNITAKFSQSGSLVGIELVTPIGTFRLELAVPATPGVLQAIVGLRSVVEVSGWQERATKIEARVKAGKTPSLTVVLLKKDEAPKVEAATKDSNPLPDDVFEDEEIAEDFCTVLRYLVHDDGSFDLDAVVEAQSRLRKPLNSCSRSELARYLDLVFVNTRRVKSVGGQYQMLEEGEDFDEIEETPVEEPEASPVVGEVSEEPAVVPPEPEPEPVAPPAPPVKPKRARTPKKAQAPKPEPIAAEVPAPIVPTPIAEVETPPAAELPPTPIPAFSVLPHGAYSEYWEVTNGLLSELLAEMPLIQPEPKQWKYSTIHAGQWPSAMEGIIVSECTEFAAQIYFFTQDSTPVAAYWRYSLKVKFRDQLNAEKYATEIRAAATRLNERKGHKPMLPDEPAPPTPPVLAVIPEPPKSAKEEEEPLDLDRLSPTEKEVLLLMDGQAGEVSRVVVPYAFVKMWEGASAELRGQGPAVFSTAINRLIEERCVEPMDKRRFRVLEHGTRIARFLRRSLIK